MSPRVEEKPVVVGLVVGVIIGIAWTVLLGIMTWVLTGCGARTGLDGVAALAVDVDGGNSTAKDATPDGEAGAEVDAASCCQPWAWGDADMASWCCKTETATCCTSTKPTAPVTCNASGQIEVCR